MLISSSGSGGAGGTGSGSSSTITVVLSCKALADVNDAVPESLSKEVEELASESRVHC